MIFALILQSIALTHAFVFFILPCCQNIYMCFLRLFFLWHRAFFLCLWERISFKRLWRPHTSWSLILLFVNMVFEIFFVDSSLAVERVGSYGSINRFGFFSEKLLYSFCLFVCLNNFSCLWLLFCVHVVVFL